MTEMVILFKHVIITIKINYLTNNLIVRIKVHVRHKGRGSTTLGHQWYDVE